MKKILLLGLLAFIPTVTQAMVDERGTSDIELLRHQGYSESTLRIIDGVKYRAQEPKKYQRHFTPKNYTKEHNAYINIKNYFDPLQDDNNFGTHQINFTNTWNGDETHYSTKVNEQVEDL